MHSSRRINMSRTSHLKAVFLPDVDELAGNPYWLILRDALGEAGAEISHLNGFGRRWLLRHRGQVDVLHFHYIQQFYAYETKHARLRWVLRFAANLLSARALGYRTVFTLHNLKPTYGLSPAWVDYLGHWCAANLSARVIVHCEAARAALAKRFGRRRQVFTIAHPNYIGHYPNTITAADARARLGINGSQTVFAFFGGIRPNKGIESLIAAFNQLRDPKLVLIIAGKPWPPPAYLSSLLKLAEADRRIRFFPQHIPDADIQLYLNAADAVVLPFTSILTSGSVMLALSFGRAVVVPALGCLPELVTPEIGFLYEPHNLGALVGALQQAMRADLVCMGRRALAKVSTFNGQALATQTLAVYR